jgi:hypothetical protein
VGGLGLLACRLVLLAASLRGERTFSTSTYCGHHPCLGLRRWGGLGLLTCRLVLLAASLRGERTFNTSTYRGCHPCLDSGLCCGSVFKVKEFRRKRFCSGWGEGDCKVQQYECGGLIACMNYNAVWFRR